MRQLAVTFHVERESNLALASLLRLDDVLVIQGIVRVRLLQSLHAKDNVLWCDGLAIVEARLRSQPKRYGRIVVRVGHPFGHEGVLRRSLIRAVCHERVEGETKPASRSALDRENVEAIKRALDKAA